MSEYLFHYNGLLSFTELAFRKQGMSVEAAAIASKNLIEADLRGIDSHGIARLNGYIRLQKAGRANFNPNFKIIHETPSTATLDADLGLGLHSANFGMQLAIEKAKQVGTGWVAIQNSNHFGIAAAHAMLALKEDMIGIALTNASPLVSPTHSKERMLGTNPICICFPSNIEPAFVLDMATSAAANGKLEIAQRQGKHLPSNWVQSKEGLASNNAHELKEGGALLPLGGHKGYGLGAMVDILSGVLSGANYGPWVPPFVSFLNPLAHLPGNGIGHFVGAMRIDAFRPAAEFKSNMDLWIDAFKKSARIDEKQPVLIPGEPEAKERIQRLEKGIPVHQLVFESMQEIAQDLGIEMPKKL
jgi:LDH2 family malate/lactate/ureidoglycolate dehydrogenase